ncbi:proprotein convertase P-domain-containing protein [Ferrimonas kyonanensis]|uniref:proprotein convertase P-domain-containing protein n=1 Tax=Ferrimonas kyonanensis TaxID=364763 RepID=UPI0003F61C81|nr:proprotein convertase P-domain-containing protein [Ferrimonas kyonanensis]
MTYRFSLLSLALCSSMATAGQWDHFAQPQVLSSADSIEAFLEQRYPQAGDLKLRYQSQSPLGRHYHFDVWKQGQYQQQRTLVATTNNDHELVKVFVSLEDTVLRDGKPTTAAELEHPRTLVATEIPGPLVAVDATLQVFNPDLRTMNRSEAPESPYKQLSDYPFAAQYQQVAAVVHSAEDGFYLANDRVREVDIQHLLTPAVGEADADIDSDYLPQEGLSRFDSLAQLAAVDMNNDRFAHTMAFHHLDRALQRLTSLGFSVFSEPLKFDGRGINKDNSTYLIDVDTLVFGIGGSPDAFDADIVLHELGHAINYHIVADWAYGHSEALGEGFGDYWAGAHSYRQQHSQDTAFELDTVFNWDGWFGFKQHTRSLNNTRARYIPTAEYRAHESVAGELSDELWSTPLFQTLKAAVAAEGSDAFDDIDSIILQAFYGVGRGVKMADMAANIVTLAGEMFPTKDYQSLFQHHFSQHGLMSAPFILTSDAPFVEPGQPAKVSLLATHRQGQVIGTLSNSAGGSQDLDKQDFERLDLTLPLPNDLACGAPFTLTAEMNVQYGDDLKPEQHSASQWMINGLPQLDQAPQTGNLILPDAVVGSDGRQNAGFKSLNFIINDTEAVVEDEFAVQLSLQHDNMEDLTINLVSPSGTRVTLRSASSSLDSTLTTTLLLKHHQGLARLKGEPLQGAWRFEFNDYQPGDAGTLTRWGVGRISDYDCGTPPTPTPSGSSGGGALWLALLALLPLAFRRFSHQ